MSNLVPQPTSQTTNNSDETRVEAVAYNILLETAQKRPKILDNITGIFYKLNLVVAFAFDSLLFYTPGLTETPPDVVSFITKLLVIGVSYIIINIMLSIFIYAIFIPVFYSYYLNSYSSFQTFVRNQYLAYEAKFGVKLLEQYGDLKTMGILAVFNTVSNTKYNKSKNINEYRSFINNDIDASLKKLKDPVLDSEIIEKIKDYFMGLPNEFKHHAKLKEKYIYQSIQLWVAMLCSIIFVIPIKYMIIDNVNKPKLPNELTSAINSIGNRVSNLTNTAINNIMPGPGTGPNTVENIPAYNRGAPPPEPPTASI